jgi:hypothetical protein
MASMSRLAALVPIGIALAACTTTSNNSLLFFGQAQTLGISVGSAGPQAPDITLGYRDVDIAVVPVTVTDAAGQVQHIRANVRSETASGVNALSVLGQFEVNAASQTPQVGLGKFFATGLAADKLADGFKAKLGNSP